MKYLSEISVPSNGWDPYYRPNDPLVAADFVNLGFVINVIEDIAERQFALTRAYSLARIAIVVSTMLASDQRKIGRPFRDGFISSIGTFQKYYFQRELQSFIDSALDESPIPLGPGVFLVFKDKDAEASFLASRVRSESRARIRYFGERREVLRTPRHQKKKRELEPRQKELLDALWSKMLDLGRAPLKMEIDHDALADLSEQFGSYKSALNTIRRHYNLDAFEESAAQRRNKIIILLAIHYFRKSKRSGILNNHLRNDIIDLFGSLRTAQQSVLELIASLKEEQTFNDGVQWSVEHGLGTWIEGKGFISHRSLIGRLPPSLQVAIRAASLLGDGLDACDLIRIHKGFDKISFYLHDKFDEDPLPTLRHQCKVDIKRHKAIDRYIAEEDRVKLVGKSRYLNEESPYFAEAKNFDRILLTVLDADWNLLHMPTKVMESRFTRALYAVDDRKLIRSNRIPELDEKCGEFLNYRDLIECGHTQGTLKVDNLPQRPESYAAFYDLAKNILDPVIEYFGSIRLTYGFCSNDLRKHIKAHVAPHLDQHAAHELTSRGQLVCSRLGAAVDFLVEDENMYEVVKWINDNLEFDRIYYYGSSRPIHVSYSETPAREIVELRESNDGKRIPRRLEL